MLKKITKIHKNCTKLHKIMLYNIKLNGFQAEKDRFL